MNEIDLNSLENNEHDVLLNHAKEELGLNLPQNIGKEKLIAKIQVAMGKEPTTNVDDLIELDDEDEAEKAADLKAKRAAKAKAKAAKKAKNEADDLDDDDVDDDVYNPNLKKGMPSIHNNKKVKKLKIMIPEVDGDRGTEDVQVLVQGKAYLIKRGVEAVVPYFIVEALKNAIEKKYKEVEIDGKRVNQERKVMSYPFQILGEA